MFFRGGREMVAVRCKSGKHIWDSSQTESLQKCCNGYVRLFQSWGYEENGGYDPWGNWNGIAVLVPEDDYEQIERIKATGPMEARANSEGPDLIM
jgi:hypothetical protein